MTAPTWDAYPQITDDHHAVILTDGTQVVTLTPAAADALGDQLRYAALPPDVCLYGGCTNLAVDFGLCDRHQKDAA